jgi:hypothetical protein
MNAVPKLLGPMAYPESSSALPLLNAPWLFSPCPQTSVLAAIVMTGTGRRRGSPFTNRRHGARGIPVIRFFAWAVCTCGTAASANSFFRCRGLPQLFLNPVDASDNAE